MSEETTCYSAEVWIDGKKAGWASNEGHGGCDSIQPNSLRDLLNDHAKATLPIRNFQGMEIKPNAETLVNKLLEDWEVRRAYDSDLKKNVLYTKTASDGTIYQSKIKRKLSNGETRVFPIDQICSFLKEKGFLINGKILNLLPYEEGLCIYKSAVFPNAQ